MTDDKILEMVNLQKEKAHHVFEQISKEVDTYQVGFSAQAVLTSDFIREAVTEVKEAHPKAADLILGLAWQHAHEAAKTAMLARIGFQQQDDKRRSKADIETRIREAEDEIALSRSYGGPDPDPGRIARLEHEIDVLRWSLGQK
jgi:hypothetical protein